MGLLYRLGIYFYGWAIRIAALFNEKAKLWVSGRKTVLKDIESAGLKDCLWMHCASLGEFEQGRPVLEELRRKHPNYPILLTFFSPSGYEVRKNYSGADFVTYLPLDTKANVSRFLDLVSPKIAVFVKYEVWHCYFRELAKRQVPLFLISSIFRPDQIYFRSYAKWFRNTLKGIDQIYTQDEESIRLLKEIDIAAVLSGDTRFDRVLAIKQSGEEMPEVGDFAGNYTTIVAGSTWPADESMLIEFVKITADTRLIIAPHQIGEGHIKEILAKSEESVRWSEWDGKTSAKILVIDAIGKLSTIYRYADISYIGGGFGRGIHNTLEAAVYGIPVVFGPNYQKFKEARDLIAAGGGFTAKDESEFFNILNKLNSDKEFRKNSGELAGNYVSGNSGATARILKGISDYLA